MDLVGFESCVERVFIRVVPYVLSDSYVDYKLSTIQLNIGHSLCLTTPESREIVKHQFESGFLLTELDVLM